MSRSPCSPTAPPSLSLVQRCARPGPASARTSRLLRPAPGATAALCTAVLALALGCAPRAVIRKTQPELSISSWHNPVRPIKRVLVLSPAFMKKMWTDLGPEAAPAFDTEDRGDPAALAVERVLFDAGWEPASETTVRRMLMSVPLAIPLGESMSRGQLWLENMVDDSPTLDGVVLLRGWDLHWSERPAAAIAGAGIFTLVAELQVELHDKGGRLIWAGRAIARSSDLQEIHATSSKKDGVRLDAPALACLAAAGSKECTENISVAGRDRMASHVAAVLVEQLAAH
jgi:hypothetical protein